MVGSVYEIRPDWRIPGLVRRKTTVFRNKGRRQGWSGRRHSMSMPGHQQPSQDSSRQPVKQPSRQHPSQQISQSRPEQNQGFLSPQIPLYDAGYASNDEAVSKEDEFQECLYIPATKDAGGRRGDPVIATPIPASRGPSRRREPLHSGSPYPTSPCSSTAHPSRPQSPLQPSRYPTSTAPYPHTTRGTNVGRGEFDGIDQAAAPEPLYDPRVTSSRTRPYPPRSSPPPYSQPPSPQAPTSQLAPREPLPARIATHGLHHPHLHAHAQNTVPRPQRRESNRQPSGDSEPVAGFGGQNAAPSRSQALPPAPPLASHYALSSERNTTHARSGLEGEGRQELVRAGDDVGGRRADRSEAERLAAEMGFEQANQAGVVERWRSIRKEGNHRMAGGERLNAARSEFNPHTVAHLHPHAHTSGISSHQQVPPPPPPPPYHTRPRSFIGVPSQRQAPAHPAAPTTASHHLLHSHPPPSSAAPRPHIHKGIPTRDSLFGFPTQEERDEGAQEKSDRLEPTLRNPCLDRAGKRRDSLKMENYDVRVGEDGLMSSPNAHPHLSSDHRPRRPAPAPSRYPEQVVAPSPPSSGTPQHQQRRQRPAQPAAEYLPPPAAAALPSDSPHSSTSSTSAVTPSPNPAAPPRRTANVKVKVPSPASHGGRLGVRSTDPAPEPRPCPRIKREGDRNVSGYESTTGREGIRVRVPGPPSSMNKTGERTIPPLQQLRLAAPPPRNPPPSSSSNASQPPRNSVHIHGTNAGSRAGGVGAGSVSMNGLTHARSPAVASDSPKLHSRCVQPRYHSPSRKDNYPSTPQSGRRRNVKRKEGIEPPKRTLRQKIGNKLLRTTLSWL